ncbi:S-layer homology domain-containing protein [Intestinimonas massiliensis (ex Afouda et al. 2020)]|uniref:S-layer homology domain-containing protein n=1 Tax=Intestinimonas massiliensis (ex Afouda et al. 2020) TaxID=1673721 RepID=UPI001031C8B6|nr:S-layer homology domain-containing protein [Intestinimonas massiliensis (ex Afouda et al. 2020)]
MKQKICALLTAAGLCLTLAVLPAPAAAFTDVSGDTATAVEVLYSLGIVSGYSDGAYHPSDGLTRAQFCKLAVLAEGHGDQVTGSAYRTLFSDVSGSHWAAPYINLAYEEGLVSGYGDGTFGPDDPVSVGQAVTVALHLLGYTTEDVGPFWPEDYMSLGEKLGLLDGISTDPDHALTRGEAALLLYGLLSQTDKEGGDYINKLCASKVADAVLLDVDAEADDGTTGLVQICTTQGLSYYEPAGEVSESLAGNRGTLLLDKTGEVCGFLPDGTVSRTVALSSVSASGITDTAGSFHSVSNSVNVLLDDTLTAYSSCWYDLEGRDTVTLYYNKKGTVDLVTASQAVAYEGVTLSGYYEGASPNTAAPDTITLLGIELPVADSGQDSLSQFSVGDRITVTLNGTGEVASAAAYSQQDSQYGVLGNGEVSLSCGLTARGTISSTGSVQTGDLVCVTSSGIGKLSVSPAESEVSLSLNLTRGTLGSIPLADNVVIYERAKNSVVVEIDLDDILVSTVSASKIDFYATNADGEVSVLLLDDVTGNAYTYGILEVGEQSGGSGSLTYTNTTVSVENSAGTSQSYITGQTVRGGAMGGIAVSGEEKAVAVVTLSQSKDVARSSFDGEDAVVVNGVRVPISDDVQVRNGDNSSWITLPQAKAYTDTFTVYYSGTLGTDAVVRVIVTQ